VIPGVCDTPDRPAARAFLALAGRASGCPCCSFYRGFVLGLLCGAAITAALIAAT
jgi:hypothetical protein